MLLPSASLTYDSGIEPPRSTLLTCAIGNSPNPRIGQTTPGLEITKKDTFAVYDATNKRSKERVRAGSDVISGAATVILTIGAGRKAARAIHEFLTTNRRPERATTGDFGVRFNIEMTCFIWRKYSSPPTPRQPGELNLAFSDYGFDRTRKADNPDLDRQNAIRFPDDRRATALDSIRPVP